MIFFPEENAGRICFWHYLREDLVRRHSAFCIRVIPFGTRCDPN
uniref:Uncharacterized protein n=1 Tax=uncultured bacterium contig00109 TaxID=1181574 RepID=A0A806KH39_9BACT|nr:hypothetical protein [uncultured bacterium contig00109]